MLLAGTGWTACPVDLGFHGTEQLSNEVNDELAALSSLLRRVTRAGLIACKDSAITQMVKWDVADLSEGAKEVCRQLHFPATGTKIECKKKGE